MSENSHIDPLEDLFRESFTGAEQTPPPSVWEGVSSGIGAGATAGTSIFIKSVIGKWVAGVATIGLISYGAWKLATPTADDVPSDAIVEAESTISEQAEERIPVLQTEEGIESQPIIESNKVAEEDIIREAQPSNTESTPIARNSDNQNENVITDQGTVSDQHADEQRSEDVEGVDIPKVLIVVDKSIYCTHEIVEAKAEGPAVLKDAQWWLDGKIFAMGGTSQRIPAGNKGTHRIELRYFIDGKAQSSVQEFQVKGIDASIDFEEVDDRVNCVAAVQANKYMWFVDGKFFAEGKERISLPCDQNEHEIQLLVYGSNSCRDSVVQSYKCAKVSFQEPDIMEVFTPYVLDGKNDEFVILMDEVDSYRLIIRDKNNRIVYEGRDQNVRWNGKMNNTGNLMPMGWYTYQLIYGNEGQESIKSGKVLLAQ